jgi:hypothetical protein
MLTFAEVRGADPARAERAATAWQRLGALHGNAQNRLRTIFQDLESKWSGKDWQAAALHVEGVRSRMRVAKGSAERISAILRQYANAMRQFKQRSTALEHDLAGRMLMIGADGRVRVPFVLSPELLDDATAAQGHYQSAIDRLVLEADNLDQETARQLQEYSSPSQAILHEYQVADDSGRTRSLVGPNLNQSELDLLGPPFVRVDNALQVDEVADESRRVAAARFTGNNADHSAGNAFQHAYGSALLARRFGDDFARDFATAHERWRGNPGPNEAMDLYNNELGRRIARENPGLTDEQLADRVEAAVRSGGGVVVDATGAVRYADEVPAGATIDNTMRRQPAQPGHPPAEVGF